MWLQKIFLSDLKWVNNCNKEYEMQIQKITSLSNQNCKPKNYNSFSKQAESVSFTACDISKMTKPNIVSLIKCYKRLFKSPFVSDVEIEQRAVELRKQIEGIYEKHANNPDSDIEINPYIKTAGFGTFLLKVKSKQGIYSQEIISIGDKNPNLAQKVEQMIEKPIPTIRVANGPQV